MNERDLDRYSRQIRFSGIGLSGQQRVLDTRVAVVGCGSLGSFQAGALLRAGVRRLVLVDRDYVELNNLQRQMAVQRGRCRVCPAEGRSGRSSSPAHGRREPGGARRG